MTKLRTFIAVDIDSSARGELALVQSRLKKELPGKISWSEPKNIHLTLKFLGDTDFEKVEAVRKKLREIAVTYNPFALELSGLGAFPNEKNPRVIWAGLSASPESGLFKLVGGIEKEFFALGFDRERNAFHPHLTLGRVKQLKANLLPAVFGRISLSKISFKVEDIIFFQSTLSSRGPTYTKIAVFPLKNNSV